ncbi:peroxiredoxin [Cytobacillus eiseniae]|uniref:Peroxiredoxin n=1 Tax=Cytobacillus eiseniae TaxID=762947 RepID=A0ABS4RAV0_9BACI|nr:TlpA disulfide reductase family protein [Cytobacillus eiseniae]MBP2239460.1 peroxiredoxin [Cytobacillus eiseniae]
MKKILLGVFGFVAILILVDQFFLQDSREEDKKQKIEKYEKIANAEQLLIGLNEGKRAPDFTLEDLNGNPIKLNDYKGKAILLNFWATWCPPCKDEMPHMEKLYQKYNNDGFEILAVNVMTSEKDPKNVNHFIEDYQLTFPIPIDEKGIVFHDYAILGYPTSFFIDSDGVIRKKVMGPVNEEEMEIEILKLL